MSFFTPTSSWWSRFQDSWLAPIFSWGPSTDPNKVAPAMAQYAAPEEWPDWCCVSREGPNLVKRGILSSLPRVMEGKQQSSILGQVDNIRLRRLAHYKCNTDWNHEFVRADLTGEHDKPLVMVWERDIPLICGKRATKRQFNIKLGLPCQSIDRVTYISEDNFADFVKTKTAFCLRTADFPSPGLDIAQVACTLETHSRSFPTYHVYSTMCYWYADSTFEVLVDMGKAHIHNQDDNMTKKGVFSYKNTKYIAYTGITRNSLRKAGLLGPLQPGSCVDEDELYRNNLVLMEGAIATTVTTRIEDQDGDITTTLSEEEQQSITQHGWNVARYLELIQKMPSHEMLLEKSIARYNAVHEELFQIQSGREAEEAKAKREAEAEQCAKQEREMRAEEAKWKREMEKKDAKIYHISKQAEEDRKQADLKVEELRRENEELRRRNEELRRENERTD